ncbi:MAG: hypothetical protein E6J18_05045 [Chloroflexi bacterium]|nr:MAG: hypothetical protein E6J18_05045 [Chloroflexota bacterium]
MTRRRWLLVGTITPAAALSAFWIFGVLIGWSACCWLTPMWLAIAMTVGAALNVLGLVVFLIRRRSWGTPILGAVQVANILFALAASVAVSPAWLLLDGAPALVILILVLVFQRSRTGEATF